MLEDLRFAYRNLSRTPGFWILAVLILGLGVGVNVTMYSTIRGIILAPMEALLDDRTMVLVAHNSRQGLVNRSISMPEFIDAQQQTTQIARFVGIHRISATLTGVREAERLQGATVSPGFFELIGARMELGRGLAAEESTAGKNRVAVLSHTLWKTKFASDSGVIGRSIHLDGEVYTVVGVAREGVWFPAIDVRFWTPMVLRRDQALAGVRNLRTLLQLKPGVTLQQANAEIAALSNRWKLQYPDTNGDWQIEIRRPYDGMITDEDRLAVRLVYLVACGVLLIACANVANLLLARSVARRREMALRLALGAGRWRLLRLAVAESLLLAAPSAVFAILLSAWSANLLAHSFQTTQFVPDQVMDAKAMLFALSVALGSTLVFGIAPALRALKPELTVALKEGARAGVSRSSRRMAGGFVVGQVAVAAALVCFSGLLLRTVLALHQVDPGFQTSNIAMVEVSAQGWKKRTPEQQRQYFEELTKVVAESPGVEAAGALSEVPQVQSDGAAASFIMDGNDPGREQELVTGNYITVTPGALETLRIPILAGRAIHPSDRSGSVAVAVVNQAMAMRLWNGNAVGKRFRIKGSGTGWLTVVGVAADVKPENLSRSTRPQAFLPMKQPLEGQREPAEVTIVARTALAESAAIPAIRQRVREFDAEQPANYSSVSQENYRDLKGGRILSGLVATFGAVALALAGAGLFALMLHLVRQRLPELGVRVALGASGAMIMRQILASGIRLVAVGLGIGMLLAFGLSRLAAGLLAAVRGSGWEIYGIAAALVILVTMASCWVPARIASKADPASLLRAE